jgi:hypothetical protein
VLEEETYARFRTALAERQLAEAFAVAGALPGYLSLADGLGLTLLAAEVGADRAFEGCAARWLARAAAERNLTLQQMLDTGSVLAAAGRGEEGNAFGSLAGLL